VTVRSSASLLISSVLVLGVVFGCQSKSKPKPSPAPSASTTIHIGIAGEVVAVPPDVLKLERSAGPQSDWWQARDKAVARLIELTNSGDPKRLGFLSPPDPRGLVVLDPLKNATVPLADLQAYKVGADPATVIKTDTRLTFPIVADDKVVSSVTLRQSNGAWVPISYGNANTIRLVMKARVAAVLSQNGSVPVLPGKAAEYTIVTVPALSHTFLSAKGIANELYLVPISAQKSLGLPAGVPVRAKDVLSALQPAALKYKGLPASEKGVPTLKKDSAP
jgi:hypothetical protein